MLRSTPTPLRRGAAAFAVTGGALSLVGATSAVPPVEAGVDTASAQAALGTGSTTTPEVALPVQMLSAVQPVVDVPTALDATELVKAVQMQEALAAEKAEAERRAAEERAAAEAAAAQAAREQAEREAAAADCGINTSGLGAVKPFVRDAAEFLGCRFGEPRLIGVASRSGASDHPSGRAVDFMVDRKTGDALAACALENMDELGISYVIWEQQINHGSGWEPMEDRGSATANHFDHVHISFGTSAGGEPTAC